MISADFESSRRSTLAEATSASNNKGLIIRILPALDLHS